MKYLGVFFLILSLFSCGGYFEKKSSKDTIAPKSDKLQPDGSIKDDQPMDIVQSSGLGFDTVKNPVFEASCVKCHQNYSFYDSVKQDLDSIVQTVETNRMPKNGPPLTDEQKKLLSDWVAGGALNIVETKPVETKPDSSPKPPTIPVAEQKLEANWSSLSRKIFFARCTSCHNPNGQAKFLDLSSRQKTFEARNKKFGEKFLINFENPNDSYLLEVILDPDEPMPPKTTNFARLNQEEVKVLTEWIGLGLP